MKIAVFGASGRTGRLFTKKALDKGHEIKALVRNPDRFPVAGENLEIIKGDFLHAGDIDRCVRKTDVVLSLIGHGQDSPASFQSEGIAHVLESMRKHDVGRIISLTGGGVRDREHDLPKFPDRMIGFIMRNLAGKATRNALADGIRHAELIRDFEGEWTIVRAPMLNDEPEKQKIEVGHVGTIRGMRLTRGDLAEFLVRELEEKNYIRQMPFLTNG